MRKQNPSPLETKHLISAGVGMLCPIPIVGEAMVAYGLYPMIKETGVCGTDLLMNSAASLAVAGLTRMEFYKPFYLPAMDFISKFF